MNSFLTTHVLDATAGAPAADIVVTLSDASGAELATGVTDADGRLALGPDRLDPGEYSLVFQTGAHFASRGVETFYPSVTVTFTTGIREHYHVPLLLSPFSYSTYRGS